jgi:hypothetical protein
LGVVSGLSVLEPGKRDLKKILLLSESIKLKELNPLKCRNQTPFTH